MIQKIVHRLVVTTFVAFISSLSLLAQHKVEMFPFGDMDQWVDRHANRSTHKSLKARSSFCAHLPIFSLIALPIFRAVCRNGQADIDTLCLLLGQFRRRIDILIITIDDRRQLLRSIP